MSRNGLLLALFLVAAMLFIVPIPVLAQTQDLDLNDVLESLGPRTGRALLYDIFLYLIFFIAFINQFLIPDKQLPITVLNFIVMGLAIAVKLLVEVPEQVNDFTCSVGVPGAVLSPNDYAVFFINVGLFIAPLLMSGGLRSVKGRSSKAVAPSIMLALFGGIYFGMFWFLEQRPCSDIPRADLWLPEAMLVLGVFSWQAIRTRTRFR